MSIKDRLQMVIKMNNLSNASFADRVGVQRSSISHIMAGRNKPSLDFIQKTLDAFPKVNAQWLITGKQSSNDKIISYSDNSTQPSIDDVPTFKKEDLSNKLEGSEEKEIERIVVFYTDGTFKATFPGVKKL